MLLITNYKQLFTCQTCALTYLLYHINNQTRTMIGSQKNRREEATGRIINNNYCQNTDLTVKFFITIIILV